MKMARDHRYSRSALEVFALFVDSDEVVAKQKALGARNIQILECEKRAGDATMRIVRELPATVPGILKRFLQPWNKVEQSEHWTLYDDNRIKAELTIDIENVPVKIQGSLELKNRAQGCVNQVRINIDCTIPFVGKPLAEFVAGDCESLIAAEYDYIKRRLVASA